jgi:hypothetical protein
LKAINNQLRETWNEKTRKWGEKYVFIGEKNLRKDPLSGVIAFRGDSFLKIKFRYRSRSRTPKEKRMKSQRSAIVDGLQ